ncbi:uncharacterized protein LOC135130152 [Zophobas morio]|uniref:uncharacterized protein LOC135130152 n=1 Tax=Zophobas morio TaxID=2755281 RepID=UPI003083A4BF
MSGKRGFTQYSTDVKIFTDFDDHKSKKLKIMSKVLVKVGDSNGDSVKEAGNVGSSSLEEVIDDVIERCIPPINNNKASVLEESQLNDNQDDIFNKAIEEHELRLAAEERRKEEMLHIPREKNLLLNPNTFKLSPSGDASVTVGFKMPTGEVVCRLYNLTETEYIDFNLREFVQFTKKIQNKVSEIQQISYRRILCVLKNYSVKLCPDKMLMFEPVSLTTEHSLFVSAEFINQILSVRLFIITVLQERNMNKVCWPDYNAFILNIAEHLRANRDADFDSLLLKTIFENYNCSSILFEMRCKMYFTIRNDIGKIMDHWNV